MTPEHPAGSTPPAPPPETPGPKPVAASPDQDPAPRRGFVGRVLHGIPVPRPQTRRGAVLLILAVLGVGAALTIGGTSLVHYSESAAFCTTCHTMTPQKKAYEASAHRNVSCGECHVEPGAVGFVKAKLAGTRELYRLVTDTYPRPIPAVAHADMPTTQETCQECHTREAQKGSAQPSKLALRASFADDEKNTRTDLAVLFRPAGAGTGSSLGVHWHVQQPVTYTSADEAGTAIDLVELTDPRTGQPEHYIAESQIRQSQNVADDIARLKKNQHVATMDCVTCHNRVGHPVPSADEAIDDAMASGAISPDLPYVKRTAKALLARSYDSTEAGRAAINGLAGFYQTTYPLVARRDAAKIAAAARSLTGIYDLTVTPEMKAGPQTYADNLGHQSSAGCFRCHDGAHFQVVKGVVTTKPIPSTCDTCHTFPQVTDAKGTRTLTTAPARPSTAPVALVSSVPVGSRPADHRGNLWVFDHRVVAGTSLPKPNTCGTCHTRSYCETCHESGAIKVDHDEMLYNHGASVRKAGGTAACAVCHQKAYCDQCHLGDVLGRSNAQLGRSGP